MKEEEFTRFLAIDYGEKRIGLALSDPTLTFAYAYQTFNNDSKLFKNLMQLISEKNVRKIILGLPYQDDGNLSSNAKVIIAFKEKLEKHFKLEVILKDESYTSEIAKFQIIQSVTKKSKRRDKGLVDRNSAAIILQEYLDAK